MNEILELASHAPSFFGYFIVGLFFLGAYFFAYTSATKYDEMELIRHGNMAAAYSLSGTMLGFIVPLASAVEHSVNPVDMVVWGVIALLIQLAAFMLTRLLLPNIAADIPAGKQAPGFFLGAVSLGVGILNAASMTY